MSYILLYPLDAFSRDMPAPQELSFWFLLLWNAHRHLMDTRFSFFTHHIHYSLYDYHISHAHVGIIKG